ncbi:MAG: hypothetical protein EOO08_03440 [Chitinophagaceae bacterium]|nr:MAG: hypothetical protein EOO08_03440 [Chitinophagaceae bacterium]
MSKQPPFEELDQRWSDLPLPDADASWKDMSALLDGEDRKRPPVLLPLLSGCAGWTLLLLVLAVGAIGVYWFSQRNGDAPALAPSGHTAVPPAASQPVPSGPSETAGESSPQNPTGTNNPIPSTTTTTPTIPTAVATREAGSPDRKTTTVPSTGGPSIAANDARRSTVIKENENKRSAARTAARTSKGASKSVAGRTPKTSSNGPKRIPARPVRATSTDGTSTPTSSDSVASAKQPGTDPKTAAITPSQPIDPAAKAPDSSAEARAVPSQVAADSLAIAKTVEAAKKKASRAVRFSAGAGISLAIPVGGQQASGPNYGGKSNPFMEHVPAAWLRAHKGRWFVQGEVRFNAPQLLPAFAFAQKTRFDTAAHAVQTDRQQLRKAWYHQFPLSVNYQVLPRLSVGAGLQWSVLYRAAGERTSLRRPLSTGAVQESVTGFQVPGFRDSFLYKSQWQLLLQTELGWRRWGLGLRYRTDLEPFLRYTSPEGELRNVYNDAFEATIRFRIWESKRRK